MAGGLNAGCDAGAVVVVGCEVGFLPVFLAVLGGFFAFFCFSSFAKMEIQMWT